MRSKQKKYCFFRIQLTPKKAGKVFNFIHGIITLVIITAIVSIGVHYYLPSLDAAGIDNIAATFTDSTATSAESRISITWTPNVALAGGDTVSIYLGPDTSGVEFTDGDADQDGTDISCTQTGVTFNGSGTQADASATSPMLYTLGVASITAPSGDVTCTIGSSATDGPSNPATADGYSIVVVTDDDFGAGVGYVGDNNDVTISATALPNLQLTVSTPDGTNCTETSGVISCDLGTVLTTTENDGTYDVDVGTSAGSGATVSLAEDGNLRNGANDINDVADGDITAGSEEYGVILTETGTAWTIDPIYAATEAPVITGPDTAATSSGPVDASTDNIDVTHRAAVATSTLALTYTHIVTWTATANF